MARQVVQNLHLPTELMARPYQLAWVTGGHEVIIYERCLVHLTFRNCYHEFVCCDVMPIMDACHLLLERPWQFNREVLYDDKKKY